MRRYVSPMRLRMRQWALGWRFAVTGPAKARCLERARAWRDHALGLEALWEECL